MIINSLAESEMKKASECVCVCAATKLTLSIFLPCHERTIKTIYKNEIQFYVAHFVSAAT